MDEQDLVRRSYEALERVRQRSMEQGQRLIDKGIIDETGKVQLWDAFLAVIAVKPGSNGKTLEYFRCLKPAFGMPGAAEIDISRKSLAQYIQAQERVITAYLDDKQNRWKEGGEVHLTSQGYLRTDANDIEEDNLGNLPRFTTIRSGL